MPVDAERLPDAEVEGQRQRIEHEELDEEGRAAEGIDVAAAGAADPPVGRAFSQRDEDREHEADRDRGEREVDVEQRRPRQESRCRRGWASTIHHAASPRAMPRAGPGAGEGGKDLLGHEGHEDVEHQQHEIVAPAPVGMHEAGGAREVRRAQAVGEQHDVGDLQQRQQRGRLDQQQPAVGEARQRIDPHLPDVDAPEHLRPALKPKARAASSWPRGTAFSAPAMTLAAKAP